MTGDDMHKELEQLREEVAALSAARASRQAAEAAPETTAGSQAPEPEEVKDVIEQAKVAVAADEELGSQFDQLFEQLEHEIKDLPAVTTLAVFSLGVLFGRLLR